MQVLFEIVTGLSSYSAAKKIDLVFLFLCVDDYYCFRHVSVLRSITCLDWRKKEMIRVPCLIRELDGPIILLMD